MLTRHLEIAFALVIVLAVAGCKSGPKKTESYRSPGTLDHGLQGFDTLKDLRSWYSADARTKEVHFFEKDTLQAVVIVTEWGHGDSWDALYFYAPNGYTKRWVPRGLWDAETRGVRVSFDAKSGMIDVRSGDEVFILRVHIAALATPPSRDW